MKKINIKIILAVFSVLIFNSCLLDNTEVDFGKGPIVVQFQEKSVSENFLKDDTGKTYDYEVEVEYFGGNGKPLHESVTAKVEVANGDNYAKEGVEFDIPNKELVIPAGSNTAKLLVKVHSAVLDSDNPKDMVLKLVSSSQNVSENKSVTKIRLQAICPSMLEGKYVYTTGKKKEVIVKSTGTGTYEVSADDRFKGNFPFYISDVCGRITVTGGFLQANYNIKLSGNGTVDPSTGNITIFYTAGDYFSNNEMVLKKVE